jgi:hypothetical protein
MIEKKYIIAIIIGGIFILGTVSYFIIKAITKKGSTKKGSTPCSSTNCNKCKTKNVCNNQDNCIYDDTKKICQTKKPCAFNCTSNGKCNELTGICDCNDRSSVDSCQTPYPTSLPSTVCFVTAKVGSNGNFKTIHNSPTGSVYSTFVITCPVYNYVEDMYTNLDGGCGETTDSDTCISFCNTLSSSSLFWEDSSGYCPSTKNQCKIPNSDTYLKKLDQQPTSLSGIRVLFPPYPGIDAPPGDIQWLLNDFMELKDDNSNFVEYYQFISNSYVNQICEIDNKFTQASDPFYDPYSNKTYGEMLGKGTQSNVVSIGISSTNLNNVNLNSIQNVTKIKEAQLIPLITEDFMKPQSQPGDFNKGTTWINLGNCTTNTVIKKGMTIYIRLKPPNSSSYIRLYLYSQSSQVSQYGTWLGFCECREADDQERERCPPCGCGPCEYNYKVVDPDNDSYQYRRTPLLYWVVWNDTDIEKANDFSSAETDTLDGTADELSHTYQMPSLGDFFMWNFYGVGFFPQLLPTKEKPLGYDTPDGGGAPSCMLPACPKDISNLYFMDKDGGGKDKSACHLLKAENDKFNCINDKETCGAQGIWGLDQNQCIETGCGNVLSSKCGSDGLSNTDKTYLCDLTRQPKDYYTINNITPSKDNNWGGSGILSVSANICNDPNTQLKNLYTLNYGDCVSNNGINNTDPTMLFADPNCVYKCSDYGMK